MSGDEHGERLVKAIEISRRCPPSAEAFSVGALIVDAGDRELAAGYSREDGAGGHAEEVAIRKVLGTGRDLRGSTLYSSMEPCSIRLSGRRSCADRIIACGIARVIFALREPPIFVACRGVDRLERHGVEVLIYPEFGPLVLAVNRHLPRMLEHRDA
jgi:diaminohydroxyphosphoribosylaminopyrimidine deaminase / 5-amino-6-(5-phosphoribosylamino)uracil reductase